jgi:two-component SAPR family response regulator
VNNEDKKRSKLNPLVIDFVEKPLTPQKLSKVIMEEKILLSQDQ